MPPLVSHRATTFRACGRGRSYDFEGIVRVGTVAVEEMLGVEEDSLAVFAQVGDRVGDHGQVLFEGSSEGE